MAPDQRRGRQPAERPTGAAEDRRKRDRPTRRGPVTDRGAGPRTRGRGSRPGAGGRGGDRALTPASASDPAHRRGTATPETRSQAATAKGARARSRRGPGGRAGLPEVGGRRGGEAGCAAAAQQSGAVRVGAGISRGGDGAPAPQPRGKGGSARG